MASVVSEREYLSYFSLVSEMSYCLMGNEFRTDRTKFHSDTRTLCTGSTVRLEARVSVSLNPAPTLPLCGLRVRDGVFKPSAKKGTSNAR